jgi:hypothetical protein
MSAIVHLFDKGLEPLALIVAFIFGLFWGYFLGLYLDYLEWRSKKAGGKLQILPNFWLYPFVAGLAVFLGWGMRSNLYACTLYFLGIAAVFGIKLLLRSRSK